MFGEKNEKVSKKVSWISVILLTILVISIAMVVSFMKREMGVAIINGETISIKEFELIMKKQAADTSIYFMKKYGVSIQNKDFWNTDYSGEVPLKVLKEKSLDEIGKIKVQQLFAREKGITKSINYEDIINDMVKENKMRILAKKEGKVIFGPVQYSEEMYYDYAFSNMVLKLKENLSQKELVSTENVLKEYYERNKEVLFKNQDVIKTNLITVNYNKPANRQKANIVMEEIKAAVGKGKGLDDIKGNDELKISMKELTFDSNPMSEDDIRHNFLSAVKKLSVGKVSEVFDVGTSIYLIQVTDKKDSGYKSYDEAKQVVIQNCADKKYNEFFDELSKKAKVEINRKAYDSITADKL